MMRGERIFASAATEDGDASDIAQTTVAFIGMTKRFHFEKIIAAAGARPIDEGQAATWPNMVGGKEECNMGHFSGTAHAR